jgi:hypothetical protein
MNDVRIPYIKNNQIFIAEKKVDGTVIGEFDYENSKILFYPLLGGVNNSEISNIINLSDYMNQFSILTAGSNYRMKILPKYKIDNGILKYKYNFDRKPGLYKLININTLRNN